MKFRSLIFFALALVTALLSVMPITNAVQPAAAQNGCGPERFGGLVPDLWFTPACNRHDICYGTCGSNRAACDSRFYEDMRAICATRSWWTRTSCYAAAWTYYQAVRNFGQGAYNNAQRVACGR
ncbi:MAG: phospholipase A2 [Anaerolineae bacterium]|nr:phospholipase [Anaerolineae bacterium]MDW8300134.1 phospholipase A2 [Anaerolineae bacterium]